MTYYIIDREGNFITTEKDEKVAEIIATELGGFYTTLEED